MRIWWVPVRDATRVAARVLVVVRQMAAQAVVRSRDLQLTRRGDLNCGARHRNWLQAKNEKRRRNATAGGVCFHGRDLSELP